jgi:multidrug resistance efflux pump
VSEAKPFTRDEIEVRRANLAKAEETYPNPDCPAEVVWRLLATLDSRDAEIAALKEGLAASEVLSEIRQELAVGMTDAAERSDAEIARLRAALTEAAAELHAMSRRLGYDGRSGIADKIERVLGGEAKS